MDNAKMINALTAAVLANASNDQIRDEADKRGVATGITLKAVEGFLVEAMDSRWEDVVAIAKLMPLVAMAEEMNRRNVNAACSELSDEALLGELKKRGKMDAVLLTDDALMREVKKRLQEDRIPDADGWLWHHIADKDGIGSKWVSENPGQAFDLVDESDKEDFAREWVRDNAEELLGEMEASDLVDGMSSSQRYEVLSELAGRARF